MNSCFSGLGFSSFSQCNWH